MGKKRIDEKIVKEAIAELKASESRSAGPAVALRSVNPARPPRQAEKPEVPSQPKIHYRIGLKPKKARRWGLFSPLFWICVFLLSGILLVNFTVWSNQRQAFKPSSTGIIEKPISAAEQMK